MIRILLAAATVIAAMAFEHGPAQADEYPWCLIGYGGGNGRCSYNSLEECLRDRAGGASFCNPNPRFHGLQQPEQKTRSARRHTRRKHNRQ